MASTLAAAAADLDVTFNVRTNKPATGYGNAVVVIARRTGPDTEYRVRISFRSNETIQVGIDRLVNGRRSVVGKPVTVPVLRYRPGRVLAVRVLVTGSDPATLAVKVWRAGWAQPGRWTLSVKDGTVQLARPGWWGMSFGVLPHATDVPVEYTYSRLSVVAAGSNPGSSSSPSPTLSAEATPTPNADATPPPSGDPTSSPSPAPTPSPVPTATASPTPTSTPAPTPTPMPSATPPANSFVVAPNGNDAWNGSASAPWRTLQKAANTLAPGATVYVRAGTYAGFKMTRSGTAAAPISFEAYPGEHPVIDGNGTVTWTVTLSGVSYVTLDGLTVQGGYAPGQDGGGVLIVDSSHVTLSNSVLQYNKAFGVRSYASTNVTIDHNEITHNATGVRIDHAADATRVTNNLIHNNDQMMVNTPDIANDDVGAIGVGLVRTTGDLVLSGNLIWGNRAPSYDYGWDGGAFDIYAASDWTITGNVTWDNENVLETGTDSAKTPCADDAFTHNLNYAATTVGRTYGMILRCGTDMLVANNTFDGMQNFVFALSHDKGSWGGAIDGLQLVNNIISVNDAEIFRIENAIPASVRIDYNLVQVAGSAVVANGVPNHGSTTNLAQFSAWTGYEVHGIQADPEFTDSDNNDYSLSAGSPAVDAGTIIPGVTDGYLGRAPDLGYLEQH